MLFELQHVAVDLGDHQGHVGLHAEVGPVVDHDRAALDRLGAAWLHDTHSAILAHFEPVLPTESSHPRRLALDRLGECSLVGSGEARAATREDLAVWVDELLERLDVFIVDTLDLCDVIIFGRHLIKRLD